LFKLPKGQLAETWIDLIPSGVQKHLSDVIEEHCIQQAQWIEEVGIESTLGDDAQVALHRNLAILQQIDPKKAVDLIEYYTDRNFIKTYEREDGSLGIDYSSEEVLSYKEYMDKFSRV
jgi:hypothetical protein